MSDKRGGSGLPSFEEWFAALLAPAMPRAERGAILWWAAKPYPLAFGRQVLDYAGRALRELANSAAGNSCELADAALDWLQWVPFWLEDLPEWLRWQAGAPYYLSFRYLDSCPFLNGLQPKTFDPYAVQPDDLWEIPLVNHDDRTPGERAADAVMFFYQNSCLGDIQVGTAMFGEHAWLQTVAATVRAWFGSPHAVCREYASLAVYCVHVGWRPAWGEALRRWMLATGFEPLDDDGGVWEELRSTPWSWPLDSEYGYFERRWRAKARLLRLAAVLQAGPALHERAGTKWRTRETAVGTAAGIPALPRFDDISAEGPADAGQDGTGWGHGGWVPQPGVLQQRIVIKSMPAWTAPDPALRPLQERCLEASLTTLLGYFGPYLGDRLPDDDDAGPLDSCCHWWLWSLPTPPLVLDLDYAACLDRWQLTIIDAALRAPSLAVQAAGLRGLQLRAMFGQSGVAAALAAYRRAGCPPRLAALVAEVEEHAAPGAW